MTKLKKKIIKSKRLSMYVCSRCSGRLIDNEWDKHVCNLKPQVTIWSSIPVEFGIRN